jgi:hypothetical protein
MIYRKTPPQPGRLLLRIVATTGAGTLLGVVACGSPAEGGCPGVCSGSEVSGSTGSTIGSSGASAGSGVSGSTGSTSGSSGASAGSGVSSSTGSTSGSSGASAGYEYAGSFTTSTGYEGIGSAPGGGAGSTDAAPPHAEGGIPDATVMEAGRIILGLFAAPDAGAEQ